MKPLKQFGQIVNDIALLVCILGNWLLLAIAAFSPEYNTKVLAMLGAIICELSVIRFDIKKIKEEQSQ